MTTQQWLQAQLTAVLTANNPYADPASITLLATELSGLWANLILPNLIVDLTTGKVSFVIPGGA